MRMRFLSSHKKQEATKNRIFHLQVVGRQAVILSIVTFFSNRDIHFTDESSDKYF